MGRFDFSKVLFYTVTTCGVLGLTFAVGLYSGATRNAAFEGTRDVVLFLVESVSTLTGEVSTLSSTRPKHFLQPARYAGAGVTVNGLADDSDDLVLLAGFFERSNELRLVTRGGDVVARWPLRFYDVFPEPGHVTAPATEWNVDTHGALALPDGSVVFNFEYAGLVKLDRCGEIVWSLPRQTHHSVERAEGGGFWVPGRRILQNGESPFPPFATPLAEDTVLKVSDDGRVLAEISVPEMFYASGLAALLTASGHSFRTGMDWDHEIVHLNKVGELAADMAADFPMFAAGDLLLSLREHNLVMVADPDTGRIKWWSIGPWLRQHDPEFKRGGTVVVFNNNTYRTAFGTGPDVSRVSDPRVSNIVEIDPVSNEHRIAYGARENQELLSVIRGKVEVTPAGGLLITEFEGGRVVETDAEGDVVWEYINRYDDDEVAEITEARVYPAAYFNVQDWSCPRAGG